MRRGRYGVGRQTDYTHAVTASDKFTLTATAKDGYIFCGWRKGNVLEYSERVSDVAITEITMEKNWVTYYADFRRNPVTVNNPSAGKVTVEYVGDSWGMRFKFTAITLDDSYYFKGWYKGENPDVTKISEGNGENYYHHFGFKDEVPVYTAVWLKKS